VKVQNSRIIKIQLLVWFEINYLYVVLYAHTEILLRFDFILFGIKNVEADYFYLFFEVFLLFSSSYIKTN
jgi:hypothetical protein